MNAPTYSPPCLLCVSGAGKVLRWQVPAGSVFFDHQATIRVDSGVSEGDTVGTNYGKMGTAYNVTPVLSQHARVPGACRE